jgi:hypothetical protein
MLRKKSLKKAKESALHEEKVSRQFKKPKKKNISFGVR